MAARDSTRRVLRLLCAVLAERASLESLNSLDDDLVARLVALARTHGVEAWLADAAPKGSAWRPLAEQRPRFLAARVRAVHDLRAIGQALASIDCPWVVLKGQAVAEDLYPKPAMRYGVDLDVLVPPTRFADVIDELRARGWILLDRNWPLFLETLPGELRLRAPTGELLDLHWHVLAGRELRRSFDLPTEALLARRRTLPSGLPALDPVDQLVHLGVHSAMSGATRLSWLLDAGLAARAVGDESAIAVAARRAHASHALDLVLLRAQRYLGMSSPGLSAGPDWHVVCRSVDRLSPLGARPDEPSLARSFARSARRTTAASLVEFGRHVTGWLGSGASRIRPRSPIRDPDDPRSPLFAVDDEGARRLYLDRVAGQGAEASVSGDGY